MNRFDLVDRIAARNNISKAEADRVVVSVFEEIMTAAFYPIALFLVFGFMVLTGTGRMMETPEPEAAEAKTATAL